MIGTFHELVIGGVLMAPFVTYALAALVIVVMLRPLLRLAAFERAFSHPPLAVFSLYVIVLAALIALF